MSDKYYCFTGQHYVEGKPDNFIGNRPLCPGCKAKKLPPSLKRPNAKTQAEYEFAFNRRRTY
jgi:hypothetical protein